MSDAHFLPNLVFLWLCACPRAPRVFFGACQCDSGVMQGHTFFQLFALPEQGQQGDGMIEAVERWSNG